MLSRTLFSYIFKDLFRIFMMSSGALAGILSFGGLLRPLTREGLDAGQVGRMLTYFTPAMTTYSFPIAALFATAVVYGRLAADNELTAARASGVSLLSLSVAGPALVLGLVVALVSLLFLCFIVPESTYKVEKVVYSNLAKLIAGRIERSHEISLPDTNTTIFAQDAWLPPPGSVPRGQQQVVLVSPTIVKTDRPRPLERDFRVPRDFFTASRAVLYIDPLPNGEDVQIRVRLDGGFKFPRSYQGATEAGVSETGYGPVAMMSPIKEDVKFMDIWKLKQLYGDISQSKKIGKDIAEFVLNGQRVSFFEEVARQLNGPRREVRFNFEKDIHYVLGWEGPGAVGIQAKEMLAPTPDLAPLVRPATQPSQTQPAVLRNAFFRREAGNQVTFQMRGAELHLFATPVAESSRIDVKIDLVDCTDRPHFIQPFSVPMSDSVKAVAGRNLGFYESPAATALGDQQTLLRDKASLFNSIIAESNGRASFAISCLILVIAGCALGMMFKSGNFLTAFAVSFVPAILSITLIIAGQRTAGHLPVHFNPANNSPLQTGLILIWAGNAVNFVLAVSLLWKLSRQ